MNISGFSFLILIIIRKKGYLQAHLEMFCIATHNVFVPVAFIQKSAALKSILVYLFCFLF